MAGMKVTTMQQMYRHAYAFNHPLTAWDVGRVTNMDSMFDDAHGLSNCFRLAISCKLVTIMPPEIIKTSMMLALVWSSCNHFLRIYLPCKRLLPLGTSSVRASTSALAGLPLTVMETTGMRLTSLK